VYRRNWGLGILEDVYLDPEVDELQVNRDDLLFVVRRGCPERLPFSLAPGEGEILARRLIMHDTGISLSESTPTAKTVRLDGTRVTAVCPPVSPHWAFALRKHGNVALEPEAFVSYGTLDRKTWDALSLFARGRLNILISGSFNAGKTTLLRAVFGRTHPALRTVVVEPRRELRLTEYYPGRNILELEAHPEAKGASLKELVETVAMRFSADNFIMAEFRGYGEAREAIRMCLKGHKGSMATTHSVSPEEALLTTAWMMQEEGLTGTPLDLVVMRVAYAYDVVVQMFYDSAHGVRRLESVTEIVRRKDGPEFRTLIRWEPEREYHGPGRWAFVNPPTERLKREMFRFGVDPAEVERLW